jgi:hypothetical protein
MKILLTGLLLALCASGCGQAPDAPLVVSDLDIRAPRPGTQMGAAYLTLVNGQDEALTITRVTSPQFAAVELHESVEEDGVARMRALPALEIGPGETMRLAPGGKHLMLMRPVANDGAAATTLNFWSGETLLVSVTAEADAG